MNNLRFRTSSTTEIKLHDLQAKLGFTSKAAIIRLAVALSLNQPDDPRIKLSTNDNDNKSNGADYWRYTLTGEDDILFKAAMSIHIGKEVTDTEYFPTLFGLHLERGIFLLENEYNFNSNKEKLFKSLLEGAGL